MVEAMTEAYVAALAGSEQMIHDTIVREEIACDYYERAGYSPPMRSVPRLCEHHWTSRVRVAGQATRR